MESFARDGFRATTVERIVDLAGTTTPTFYRHFSSKNDLLGPLQEHLTAEVRAVMSELSDIQTIDFASIRDWINRFAAMWQRMHWLCAAYWEAGNLDPSFLAEALPSALRTVQSLDRFVSRFDEPDRRRAQLRLTLLVPLFDRVMQVTEASHDSALAADVRDQLAEMMVLAFNGPDLRPVQRD
jgi:AcrR family transcriptional regulator